MKTDASQFRHNKALEKEARVSREANGGKAGIGRAASALRATMKSALFVGLLSLACLCIPMLGACSSAPSSASQPSTTAAPAAASKYFLAVNADGYVAVYAGKIGDGSDPERVTEIRADDLTDSIRSDLSVGMEFDSLDAAIDRAKELQSWVEQLKVEKDKAAQQAMEADQAKREAQEAQQAAEEAAAAQQAADTAAAERQLPESAATVSSQGFWGVWIGAFGTYEEAERYMVAARGAGLPADVFLTTDWNNLNSDPYYVVSVGTSAAESIAAELCDMAKKRGYPDAYVKFTGARK